MRAWTESSRGSRRPAAAAREHLVARGGAQMRRHLRAILAVAALAGALAASGREDSQPPHPRTLDELLGILAELGRGRPGRRFPDE